MLLRYEDELDVATIVTEGDARETSYTLDFEFKCLFYRRIFYRG